MRKIIFDRSKLTPSKKRGSPTPAVGARSVLGAILRPSKLRLRMLFSGISLDQKMGWRRGVSSLPLILILGGLITTMALGATLLVFLVNNANLGERASAEALAIARSGIDDGILQVLRNKNCPDASCLASYEVSLDNRTAAVTICKDFCDGICKHTIISIAQVLTNHKKIKAILETDPITGEVLIESIADMPL